MFYIIILRSNLRNQLKKLFGANSFEVLVKANINDYLTKHNVLELLKINFSNLVPEAFKKMQIFKHFKISWVDGVVLAFSSEFCFDVIC